MKRLLKYLAILLAFAAIVAVLSAGIWLLGTEAGARKTLAMISSRPDLQITVEHLEGRIAGNFHLRGVTVDMPDLRVTVDTLQWRFDPLRFFWRVLVFGELSLQGVHITDTRPASPAEPAWPSISGWATFLDARINRLAIDSLSYARTDEPSFHLTHLEVSVLWQNGTLHANGFQFTTDMGTLSGNLAIGLVRPSLTAALSFSPTQPAAGMEHFYLSGNLGKGKGSDWLAGDIHLSGRQAPGDDTPLWEATATIALSADTIRLLPVHLRRPDQAGLITAQGEIRFGMEDPTASLRVVVSDWEAPQTRLGGTITFDGSAKGYRGDLNVVAKTEQLSSEIRLAAGYTGDAERIHLDDIRGDALGGSLTGRLDADWSRILTIEGELHGRNLDIAMIDPAWTGTVNLDIKGNLSIPESGAPGGQIHVSLHDSVFLNHALTGNLRATFADQRVQIQAFQLAGRGFDVRARGDLSRQLHIDANISDLSALVPQARGRITATGWCRFTNGRAAGSLSGRAFDLALGDVSAGTVQFQTTLDDHQEGPFTLSINAERIRVSDNAIDQISLQGTGTPASHTLQASAKADIYTTHVKVMGSYQDQQWRGSITGLSFSDGKRDWRLSSPAPLAFQDRQITLGPVNLKEPNGARLDASADLTLDPLSGVANIEMEGFSLDWLAPLLPEEILVEGQLAGAVQAEWFPDQSFTARGHLALSPSRVRWQGQAGEIHADIRHARADWQWEKETLNGTIALTLAEHGELSGRYQLPLAARLPLEFRHNAPIDLTLSGRLREKGLLAVLLPELISESQGELDLDLHMGGTWEVPALEGHIRLSGGGGYLPAAGITLKNTTIAARLRNDTVYIDTFRTVSGSGTLDGSAQIRVRDGRVATYEGRLTGERFQILYFPELQVQASPELTFSGTPEKLRVRGNVVLPVVRIFGTQQSGYVEPSPDVIIEGREAPAGRTSRLELDVRIRLILGDSVELRAAGIDAQLGGQVDLQIAGDDPIAGQGELRVIKGRFRTYGVNLEIVRGLLFYAGGRIDEPVLDLLALRTVGNVRAGVTVTGTPQTPFVRLYSEPAMQDVDILSYIVLGRPLAQNDEEVNLLVMAAGALLTSRQTEDILRQMGGRLGLSTFEISQRSSQTSGLMGYKPMALSPEGGSMPLTQVPADETMLMVGKYLTPKLYVRYGRSIFSGSNLFLLRYDLTRNWQIESQMGAESGVDLYYTIEFD